MKVKPFFFALALTALMPTRLRAAEVTFTSGTNRVSLLELYTSEGCSSCPPAEKWLSGLKKSPGLWRDFVPVAFHVDYWDGLGWPDRFASKEFTQRQYAYATAWNSEQVYTPEFVLNGGEWRRGWSDEVPKAKGSPGELICTFASETGFTVEFKPASSSTRNLEVWLAELAMEKTVAVKAGENTGRNLTHDFAVLRLRHKPLDGKAMSLNFPTDDTTADAIATWVVEGQTLKPIQTVGGLIRGNSR